MKIEIDLFDVFLFLVKSFVSLFVGFKATELEIKLLRSLSRSGHPSVAGFNEFIFMVFQLPFIMLPMFFASVYAIWVIYSKLEGMVRTRNKSHSEQQLLQQRRQ